MWPNLPSEVGMPILLAVHNRRRRKYFHRKKCRTFGVFYSKLQRFCAKKFILKLLFKKNFDSFAENWQKSPKSVTVTLNPGVNFMDQFWSTFTDEA
jgi:hypothetical protein